MAVRWVPRGPCPRAETRHEWLLVPPKRPTASGLSPTESPPRIAALAPEICMGGRQRKPRGLTPRNNAPPIGGPTPAPALGAMDGVTTGVALALPP